MDVPGTAHALSAQHLTQMLSCAMDTWLNDNGGSIQDNYRAYAISQALESLGVACILKNVSRTILFDRHMEKSIAYTDNVYLFSVDQDTWWDEKGRTDWEGRTIERLKRNALYASIGPSKGKYEGWTVHSVGASRATCPAVFGDKFHSFCLQYVSGWEEMNAYIVASVQALMLGHQVQASANKPPSIQRAPRL